MLLGLLLAANSNVEAQEAPEGTRGQPVRVRARGGNEWRGHLLAPLFPQDRTAYVCHGRPVQCETDSTLAVRLSRGDTDTILIRTGTGAGRGAIVGGVVGAGLVIAGALIYNGLDDTVQRGGRTGRVILGTVGITGVGALIGGWIGSTHERWERIW
jgi:hypothetical protein